MRFLVRYSQPALLGRNSQAASKVRRSTSHRCTVNTSLEEAFCETSMPCFFSVSRPSFNHQSPGTAKQDMIIIMRASAQRQHFSCPSQTLPCTACANLPVQCQLHSLAVRSLAHYLCIGQGRKPPGTAFHCLLERSFANALICPWWWVLLTILHGSP